MAGGFEELPGVKAERTRVTRLLRRDRVEREREVVRAAARKAVDEGRASYLDEAKLGPTPEHTAKVEFEPYLVEKHEGTVRSVETLRRVSVNRVKQLHDRNILNDETYPACLWYQRTWEACHFTLGASAANWGDQVRGDPLYGMGPKTPAQLEARHNFRHAREFIPGDMVALFDLVVLEEFTIREAARISRCRYSNAPKVVQAAALRLLGGVAQFLPVRAAGAPGSAPDVISEGDAVAAVDAEAAAEHLRERLDQERAREPLAPIFIDANGYFRPRDQVAAILRMRADGMTDEEILAAVEAGE